MKGTHPGVALLAPVPMTHLSDGVVTCADRGKVAFGSRAYDVFAELDRQRKGLPVEVLIYASHSDTNVGPQVTWRGRYIGFVTALLGGRHPQGQRFRPPSTQTGEDEAGHWLVFWGVDRLQPLEASEWIKISELRNLKRRRTYERGFVPEGPIIIAAP